MLSASSLADGKAQQITDWLRPSSSELLGWKQQKTLESSKKGKWRRK